MYRLYRDPASDPFKITPKENAEVRALRSNAYPMVLVSSAQTLRRVSGRREYYDAIIKDIVKDMITLHYKEEHKCVLENVGLDGSILDNPAGRTINPGHSIENSWFLLNNSLVNDDKTLQNQALNILNWHLDLGWDKEFGGVYYFRDLFGRPCEQLEHDMKLWWVHNETLISTLVAHFLTGDDSYEEWYDRIVSFGELISTTIVSEYLNYAGIGSHLLDMRRIFLTSNRFRDANIDIVSSTPRLKKAVELAQERVIVGQGFIGATEQGATTTIGREGSDYSAAVAGYILDAESVSIWKDVEGILNGDPKQFEDVSYIPELTYLDAIELAYSGAQIIHPKTIKPLQNKRIPLYVKCFVNPSLPGSVIKAEIDRPIDKPILILKKNQILLSIKPEDYSFILEERMAEIFKILESYRAKVHLVQNSAISMALCIDSTRYLDEIVEEFHKAGFTVKYNSDMELLTIRGYHKEHLVQYAEAEGVYMTQRSRKVLRIIRKTKAE
jgi:aspartate kinase